MPQEKPRSLRIPRKGDAARRIEVYSAAYKLAWRQIPRAERRARPNISLRIHAFIRRQVKDGAMDPIGIASAALKEINEWLT
jgi:hypothetical protein